MELLLYGSPVLTYYKNNIKLHAVFIEREKQFCLCPENPQSRCFRGLGLLLVFFLGALLLAAMITPLAYQSMEFWHKNWPLPLTEYLGHKGLDKYFNRILTVVFVLGLPVFIKVMQVGSWRNLMGAVTPTQALKQMLWALVGGVLLLSILVGLQYSCSYRIWIGLPPLAKILGMLGAALLIGFLEEILFRGLIFRAFYSAFRPWVGLLLTSLFFAYVHFKVPGTAIPSDVTLISGLSLAYLTLTGIAQEFQLLPFLNLFSLALLLNILYLKYKSLYYAIGLHAGLVWILMFSKKAFQYVPGNLTWLIGNDRIITGLVPLALQWILILWVIFRKQNVAENIQTPR